MSMYETDSTEISCGFTTLLRQAHQTADTYLANAIRDIDAWLGEGYAAKNPGLIGTYMKVAAMDFDTASRSLMAQKDREARYQMQDE